MDPGDLLELEVERLVAGGDGLARSEGRAIFVGRTAPGDRVLVRVREVRPRFARAALVRVLVPGPGRRSPPCPHFETCGGCSWLHLDDTTQREGRLSILRDALVRIGRLRALPAIEWLGSPRPLGYRSRARVSVESGVVGFRERRSHRVVDVERCAVLDAPTQQALASLREGRGARDERAELELRGFGEQALGLHVSRGAFFQANGALWEEFRGLVADACGEGERALELYAGVGFFTRALESRFRSVTCVERGPAAADLRRNTRARVHEMPAERFIALHPESLAVDTVLLNPPRSGCHKNVSDALAASAASRIVYVSCDPATLARDLAVLEPRFALTRVTCIDALPQTHHVEAMAVLRPARELAPTTNR